MKSFKLTIGIIILTILFTYSIYSEETNNSLPSVKLKNLLGETIDTKAFSNEGKPFIINFWATWCKSCILELSSINDVYEDWQKETGVKIFAISIDDSRNSKRVAPFVKGRKWNYDVYIDENSDFKRAMNVNNPPHTFLCNGKGEIVWQHNGYAPGDEEELINQVRKIIADEKNK
jgi:cytochrome c biogenesis protein CcmG, thiol:disulfide interchange protein DsbE